MKIFESISKLANFWYIDGELVGPCCDIQDGENFDGYVTCEQNHLSSWEKSAPDLAKKYTYLHFPRGRVGFNCMTRSFYVIGEAAMIKDRTFQRRVKEKYHLPEDTDFKADDHYSLDLDRAFPNY